MSFDESLVHPDEIVQRGEFSFVSYLPKIFGQKILVKSADPD